MSTAAASALTQQFFMLTIRYFLCSGNHGFFHFYINVTQKPWHIRMITKHRSVRLLILDLSGLKPGIQLSFKQKRHNIS